MAREFLASLDVQELASLPPACRPACHFEGPEAIVTYAFTLVQADVGMAAANPALSRMANFFSAAARRVGELMSKQKHAEAANSCQEAEEVHD